MNLSLIYDRFRVADEDAKRIGLFTAAVAAKSVELAREDPAQLVPFVSHAANLAADFAQALRPPKRLTNLLRWLTSDPTRDCRERARRFAAEWDLDPVLRKALG